MIATRSCRRTDSGCVVLCRWRASWKAHHIAADARVRPSPSAQRRSQGCTWIDGRHAAVHAGMRRRHWSACPRRWRRQVKLSTLAPGESQRIAGRSTLPGGKVIFSVGTLATSRHLRGFERRRRHRRNRRAPHGARRGCAPHCDTARVDRSRRTSKGATLFAVSFDRGFVDGLCATRPDRGGRRTRRQHPLLRTSVARLTER